MMSNRPDQPQYPTDLPKTLYPYFSRPVRTERPDELEQLAKRPSKLLKPPDHKQKRNLAQYKGRSLEGNKRARGNLIRRTAYMSTLPDKPAESKNDLAIKPDVPLAFPGVKGLDTRIGRANRHTMSQDEYSLYVETWDTWIQAHGSDYSFTDSAGQQHLYPEDAADLHTICMETVIQWRLQMYQAHKPSVRVSGDYDRSVRRMQVARVNLQARRADRNSKKGNINKQYNIAYLAGATDSTEVVEAKKQEARRLFEAEEDFFKKTEKTSTHEIIDVQPTEGEQ